MQVHRRLLGERQGSPGSPKSRRCPPPGGEERPSPEFAWSAPWACLRKALKKAVVDLMTGPDVGPTTPDAAM